jgi:hypothetical protein
MTARAIGSKEVMKKMRRGSLLPKQWQPGGRRRETERVTVMVEYQRFGRRWRREGE